MAEWVRVQGKDGFEFGAYVARPEHEPKGMLVVVQEIFGVNAHIRSVTDGFAKEGYLCIAPAIFDRYERDVEQGYDKAGWARAVEFYQKLNHEWTLMDVAASIDWLRNETELSVGIVGYCYGGSIAWLAAARLDVDAAVGYYGGLIPEYVDEQPKCLVMLHYGKEDTHIPAEAIAKIETRHPEIPVFLFEGAGHAFNRDADPTAYKADAAREAKKRTLTFFQQHLAF